MGINMRKGDQPVTLTKTTTMRARVMWPPQTDYDLGAEVVYADGRTESIAAFPAEGIPARLSSADGAVRHLGDVKRSDAAMAEEVIEVTLNDTIAAVVPWAYSAQSNGAGSFHRYRVSMEVDNGQGESVRIDAVAASRNPVVYTCVPGVIENTADGVRVHALELYSGMGSENRPKAQLSGGGGKGILGRRKTPTAGAVEVRMDQGPKNVFK
ncbi:hypothetical protein [Streptomyces synnematoformans]|uniref:Uncharacterized protein n=1 Tax=Streptomyces synnematoformans TaxID=415721 RepID=A0ABN2X9E0_9ACTN